MNPFLRVVLEYLLTRNLVFILFFALLLPLTGRLSLGRAAVIGLKWSLAIMAVMLLAAAWSALLPAAADAVFPAGVLLLTLAAAAGLQAWGALPGTWAGLPCAVLAYIPLAGSMLLVRADNLAGLDAVAAALGAGLGCLMGIVLITAINEQLSVSDAPAPYHGLGALLFATALFAVALAGFWFV